MCEKRTEFVDAQDQDRLVDLEAENLGLDEVDRLAVDAQNTLAALFNVIISRPSMQLPY